MYGVSNKQIKRAQEQKEDKLNESAAPVAAQTPAPAQKTTGGKLVSKVSKQPLSATTAAGMAASGRSTTSSGFYSLEDSGRQLGSLRLDVGTSAKRMNVEKRRYESAAGLADELYNRAVAQGNKVEQLRGKLRGEDGAASFQALEDEYTKYTQEYVEAYRQTQAAAKQYETAATEYETAYSTYNNFYSGLVDEFSNWKGTIRRGDANGESEALREKIKQLEAVNAQLERKSASVNVVNGSPAINQQIERNNQQIAQLEQQLMAVSPQWEADGLTKQIDALQIKRDKLAALVISYTGQASEMIPEARAIVEAEIEACRQDMDQIQAQIDELTGRKELTLLEQDYAKWYQYGDLMENEDFEELSQYKTTANGNEVKVNIGGEVVETGFDDTLYDYINKNPDAMEVQALRNVTIGDRSNLQQMNDQEISIYNYLYAKEGPQAAQEYINFITSDLNARKMEQTEEYFQEYATEHPVGASYLSVMMSPLKGMDYISQGVDYLTTGKIDPNEDYNKISRVSDVMRSSVSQVVGSNFGPVGSFAYNTGMGMADFVVQSGFGQFGNGLSLAIMGTGAAADTVIQAKDRGLSDDQAFTLGTVAGLAEVVTEKISLETLLDRTNLGEKAMGYILKNMLAEGSEEAASDIINLTADILVSKSESEWRQAMEEYIRSGDSAETAFMKALGDQAVQMGVDFAGGVISGGALAGFNVFMNKGKSPEGGPEEAEKASGAALDGPVHEIAASQVQDWDAEKNRVLKELAASGKTGENEAWRKTLEEAEGATRISGAVAHASQEDIETASRLSEVLKRSIVFQRAEEGRNGWYDPESGTIYINPTSEKSVAQIVAHELTHSIESKDGGYYELRNAILQRMKHLKIDIEQVRNELTERYASYGCELSEDQAEREAVAEFVENHMLTDEASIMAMVKDNRTVAQRIHDRLSRLLAKLGGKKSKERSFLLDARTYYRKALAQTGDVQEKAVLKKAMIQAYQEGRNDIGDALHERIYSNEDLLDTRVKEKSNSLAGTKGSQTRARSYSLSKKPDNGSGQDQETGGETKEDQEQREARGEVVEDQAHYTARMKGYPVLNGEQVIPHSTHVYCADRDNYGLVVGKNVDGTKLWVNFWNKEHKIRTDALLDVELLTPVRGEYQMSDAEIEELLSYEPPIDPEGEISQEDLKEVNELMSRAWMHDMNARTVEIGQKWEPVTEENLNRKAAKAVEVARRVLIRGTAKNVGISRFASTESIEGLLGTIVNEYLEKGMIDPDNVNQIFESIWEAGEAESRKFYDKYKELERKIRETAITLEPGDRGGIADFDKFSERVRGTMTMKEEGGEPVSSLYAALRKDYAELLPKSITNPADQLRRLYEVGKSIRAARERLVDGPAEADLKAEARAAFDEELVKTINRLWAVHRYAAERKAKTLQQEKLEKEAEEKDELDMERMMEQYKVLRKAHRDYERASARNLLTEEDRQMLYQLLAGRARLEELDNRHYNVEGLREVLEAKLMWEAAAKPIQEYKTLKNARLRAQADALLDGVNVWKDKKAGILYSMETMERNIRDIVPNPEQAKRIIDTYIKPVHEAAARSTLLKNEMRGRVRELNLSRNVRKGNEVSESAAVQILGENQSAIENLKGKKWLKKDVREQQMAEHQAAIDELKKNNPEMDWGKVEGAVEEFRKIYNELFDMMNEARVRNGYEPVPYRKGYFPHFNAEEPDGMLEMFAKALGIDADIVALPTDINGLTHTFRPGIQWFGHALERKTDETTYDAVQGFDQYIEGAAKVICQTDNIQRLRALSSQIRYRTTDAGIREEIDKIRERVELPEKEREEMVATRLENAHYAANNFVVELEEYTNLLAGKKSRKDREMERDMGRRAYAAVKNLESRVAANMVALNPGSWLTNFIPLGQGWSALKTRNLLRGMLDTLQKTRDEVRDNSTFLVNRRGSDVLVQTASQRWADTLSKPMGWIDGFTSESLIRGRYYQNLQKGMSQQTALEEADAWVAGVMADRSEGATPTLFQRSSPMVKAFTMFQLEVNNQFRFLQKDLVPEMLEQGLAALAMALLKFAVGAWVYNEIYERAFARRPAFDPINILLEIGSDTARAFREEDYNAADVLIGNAGNLLEQVPFVGSILGGGRLPVQNILPDWERLAKGLLNDQWDAGKRIDTVLSEASGALAYALLPFGGGQIKKIVEGLSAVWGHGSYTMDADGNEILQYPLLSDGSWVKKAAMMGKAAIFGKSSFQAQADWVEDDFANALNAKETALYKQMIEAGVSDEDAYLLLVTMHGDDKMAEMSDAEADRLALKLSEVDGESKWRVFGELLASGSEKETMAMLEQTGVDLGQAAKLMIDLKADNKNEAEGISDAMADLVILRDYDISDEAKAVVYRERMASDKDKELISALVEDGAELTKVTGALMLIKIADNTLLGADRATAMVEAVAASGLTEQQMNTMYSVKISENYADEIEAMEAMGIGFRDFLGIYTSYRAINEQEGPSATEKATQFAKWLDEEDFTDAQKAVIRESMKFYTMIPAEAERYNQATAAGLTAEQAYAFTNTLNALEPPEGKNMITDLQKWRAAVDEFGDPASQVRALEAVMKDAQWAEFTIAYDYGVEPNAYVELKEIMPEFDANGNQSYSNAEVQAAIDSMSGLTTEQRAVLWQLFASTTSAKNNPYSRSIGEEVLARK